MRIRQVITILYLVFCFTLQIMKKVGSSLLNPHLLINMKFLFSCFLYFFCINLSWSRHIIGSDFYYDCKGIGKTANSKSFSFHLDVYRDCSTPIQFNPNAAFGIYTYSETRGYRFVDQVNIPHGDVRRVTADQNPCLIIPPNVCVETTDYQFIMDLPIITETYVIYYIQCCADY